MVSVAQLVERQIVALVVVGSSPIAHPIKWPHRLTVRTSLFQGENTGSIPVGVTNFLPHLMKLNKNLAISESGFAFNGTTGDTFFLNETALFIIQKLKQNLSQEEILEALINEYNVIQLNAERDLLDFLNQLRIHDLIED